MPLSGLSFMCSCFSFLTGLIMLFSLSNHPAFATWFNGMWPCVLFVSCVCYTLGLEWDSPCWRETWCLPMRPTVSELAALPREFFLSPRTRLSLSDSQLANENLDDFQAIVNYVLFQNLSSLRSSRMPFLYLGSHLLCLYARLTLFTVVFRGIETQRCTEANCTSHSICSKVLKRQWASMCNNSGKIMKHPTTKRNL